MTVELQKPIKGNVSVTIQPTDEQIIKMNSMNQSQRIRFLFSEGYSTPENKYSGIGNYLGIRTQMVRNILLKPLKK